MAPNMGAFVQSGFLSSFLSSFFVSFFFRPASFNALSMSHSICPFTLRNSSAAHFSMALNVSSSILNTNDFFKAKIQFNSKFKNQNSKALWYDT